MKQTILIFGLLVVGLSMQAQETESFTLKEAIAYSQTKSNVVRTADLDIMRAKAEVQEYTSVGIPKLSAQVEYNYFIHLPTQLIPNDAFSFELPPPFPPLPEPEPGLPGPPSPPLSPLACGYRLLAGAWWLGGERSDAHVPRRPVQALLVWRLCLSPL